MNSNILVTALISLALVGAGIWAIFNSKRLTAMTAKRWADLGLFKEGAPKALLIIAQVFYFIVGLILTGAGAIGVIVSVIGHAL